MPPYGNDDDSVASDCACAEWGQGLGRECGDYCVYSGGGYDFLCEALTAKRVEAFFKPMGVGEVTRYELPNLGALNFILPGILDGGGSRSLRIDAQGKALGMALLEMPVEILEETLDACLPSK